MRGGDKILAAILATIDQKVHGGEICRVQQTFQTGPTIPPFYPIVRLLPHPMVQLLPTPNPG